MGEWNEIRKTRRICDPCTECGWPFSLTCVCAFKRWVRERVGDPSAVVEITSCPDCKNYYLPGDVCECTFTMEPVPRKIAQEDRGKELDVTLFSYEGVDEADTYEEGLDYFDCRFKRNTGPYPKGKQVHRIRSFIHTSRMEVFEEKGSDTPDQTFDLYLMPILRPKRKSPSTPDTEPPVKKARTMQLSRK